VRERASRAGGPTIPASRGDDDGDDPDRDRALGALPG
jgi:hypothetical protein